MRTFEFNPRSKAPIVSALISGPKGTRKVRLIFDTGAEMTQLNAARTNDIGYTHADAVAKAAVVGAGGVESEGYAISINSLIVLGSEAEHFKIAIFEMEHLQKERIDGLLGWDVIRAFHLEMDGPKGLLKVF